MSTSPEPRVTGRLVRPYAMTAGRTGEEVPEIALEAHVVATSFGAKMPGQFRWEAAAIVARTGSPIALIELAAVLDLPIGVVRVLVGDLEEMGAVTVSNPAAEMTAEGGESYAELLQKVLDGIKSI